jgi:hypothetical protein
MVALTLNDLANKIVVRQLKARMRIYGSINSKRYKTHCPRENVLGLASIHASNYEYIKSIESFDVFSIHASNEMFVPGAF